MICINKKLLALLIIPFIGAGCMGGGQSQLQSAPDKVPLSEQWNLNEVEVGAGGPVTQTEKEVAEDGSEIRVVTFSGGYVLNPIDKGRPVLLIASALGVGEEVFRDAFSKVTPAAAGKEPSAEQVRANKQVLLDALGPYGISNARLDEVTNYYRYNTDRGEVWRRGHARATAAVQDGKVIGFTLEGTGHGYTSTPTVTVHGIGVVGVDIELGSSSEFVKNGAIVSITIKEE